MAQLTKGAKIVVTLLIAGIIGAGLWFLAPGLRTEASKQLEGMTVDNTSIDNTMKSPMLELPSKTPSTKVLSQPRIRIAGYRWDCERGIFVANGGAITTKGSLMEQANINLELVPQDWLSELSNMQLKFIEQYNKGQEFPDSDKAAAAIIIMGDGAPFYISTRQKMLDKIYGKGKYHLQVMGCMGLSQGEDKLIGSPEWKTNPQTMRGAVISVVIGDGDWVTALNYCFSNKIPVNPDFKTYDPDAVNFYPSADDDYMNSAKELIASQTSGFKVELKEVKNGKLTGNTVKKAITGCATWTPGDKLVFDKTTGLTDIASTKDFKNQMATTIIFVKEWAEKHPKLVSDILKATLTATNQIKQYDQWERRSCEAIAEGFKLEDADYWYKISKGYSDVKNGVPYSVGGGVVMNYADVMQYYGVTDGTNRYKKVYNQVSNYLTGLNPFGFNEETEGVVPYDEAVNLFFLKNINDIDAGTTQKTDYSKNKTEVFASGDWQINFATGSADVQSSSEDELESIANLLSQAEGKRVRIVGHTDNTGNSQTNRTLSKMRADAVANILVSKGISRDVIQEVEGRGDTEPTADNSTSQGKAKNRRVQVTLLQ